MNEKYNTLSKEDKELFNSSTKEDKLWLFPDLFQEKEKEPKIGYEIANLLEELFSCSYKYEHNGSGKLFNN